MKKLHVKMTFTEAVLGTWPSNQNIAREFIASKSPDAARIEDEVAALGVTPNELFGINAGDTPEKSA